jgi:hypothetical protein
LTRPLLMIRLLRKIRQKLLSENSYSVYLLYAGGEILLVVIGILLALQIDNWNELKQIRNTEQQYLSALKEEFLFNHAELERVAMRNKENADNMKILANLMGPAGAEITEEALGNLLVGALAAEIQYNSSQGVLDEIISSGKLGMFSNQDLRFALSSWSGRLYKLRLKEEELSRLRLRTIDKVRNEGNLRMTHGSWIEETGIKRTSFQKGNRDLMRSASFEGHLVGAALMSLNLHNYHFPSMDEEIDRILLLIEEEIK